MKYLLFFLCSVCSLLASSQEFFDSVYWVKEMEDNVSGMTITPVEHPEEMLKRVLERLERDVAQKHQRREYELEATYIMSKGPLTIRRTFAVEGDNGINVTDKNHFYEEGPLSFEGPYRVTVQDSSKVEFDLSMEAYRGMVHLKGFRFEAIEITQLFSRHKLEKVYKSFLKSYNVTAYSIENEERKSVLCIQLKEREKRDSNHTYFHITLSVDPQSLRLKQMKGTEYRLYGNCYLYKHDFTEEDGTPILMKSTSILTQSGRSKTKYVIQLKAKR